MLDDGGETDLDLGNYERFLDISLGALCARVVMICEQNTAVARGRVGLLCGVGWLASAMARDAELKKICRAERELSELFVALHKERQLLCGGRGQTPLALVESRPLRWQA